MCAPDGTRDEDEMVVAPAATVTSTSDVDVSAAGEQQESIVTPGTTNRNDVTPKPYSKWYHPYKTWIDIFLSILMHYLLPLEDQTKYPPTSEEGKKVTESLRSHVVQSYLVDTQKAVDHWSKCHNCDIVEYEQEIPRNVDILKTWGILPTNDDIPVKFPPNEDSVKILVRFPMSLLVNNNNNQDERRTSDKKAESGCVTLMDNNVDFSLLPAEVPRLIYFHGGGLVAGSRRDPIALKEVSRMSEDYKRKTGPSER